MPLASRSASTPPWRSSISAAEAMCSFGISRMCTGACGFVSRNANTVSDSCMTSDGISRAAIRQKMHSASNAVSDMAAA